MVSALSCISNQSTYCNINIFCNIQLAYTHWLFLCEVLFSGGIMLLFGEETKASGRTLAQQTSLVLAKLLLVTNGVSSWGGNALHTTVTSKLSDLSQCRDSDVIQVTLSYFFTLSSNVCQDPFCFSGSMGLFESLLANKVPLSAVDISVGQIVTFIYDKAL